MDKEPKSGPLVRHALRWDNPEAARAWLALLREQIHDALAAGKDATRRCKKRVLSRAEARRKLRVAERNIESLLTGAERGLRADPPPEEPS